MEDTKQNAVNFEAAPQPQPLTEEELKQRFNAVVADNNSLMQRLQQADVYINELQLQNLFTYISFLFKVMEHAEMYSSAFIERCVNDVETLLTRLHSIVGTFEEKKNESAQTE